jgi:sec-independent protein translocase protein TatA
MGWDAPWHWVILAIIVIALFGYKKLPDAARSVGKSLRIFKTEIKGMSDDDRVREEKAREEKAREEQARAEAEAAAKPAIAPASEAAAATPPPAPAPVTTPVTTPAAQPNGTVAPQPPHTD